MPKIYRRSKSRRKTPEPQGSFLRTKSSDARRGRHRAAYLVVRSLGQPKEMAREIADKVRPRTLERDAMQKTRQAVEAGVKLAAEEILGLDPNFIRLDQKWGADLNADSLDCVELIMDWEEEFDVIIPDEAAEKWATVEDAVVGILELVNGK